jgi:hypothetical protein
VSRSELEALKRFPDYEGLSDGTLMRIEGNKEFRIYCHDVEGVPFGVITRASVACCQRSMMRYFKGKQTMQVGWTNTARFLRCGAARVAATEDHGIGMLAFRQVGEDFLLHRGKARSAGDESLIAGLQALRTPRPPSVRNRKSGSCYGSRRCDHFNYGTVRCRRQLSRMARLRRAAHDRLIGDDDRRPRRDRVIDFCRKLRIHP